MINIPPRGIGDKTIMALHTAANQAGLPPGMVVMDLARADASPYWAQFSGRAALPLADFGAMLGNWRADATRATVNELFDRIVADLNYQEYIDDGTEEGEERWENVQELRRLTMEYGTRTLDEFLQDVALISDQDTITEGKNAPTLLTLHAAKGLEFGTVFIVGLDDGILRTAARSTSRKRWTRSGGCFTWASPGQRTACTWCAPCGAAGGAMPRRRCPPATWTTSRRGCWEARRGREDIPRGQAGADTLLLLVEPGGSGKENPAALRDAIPGGDAHQAPGLGGGHRADLPPAG